MNYHRMSTIITLAFIVLSFSLARGSGTELAPADADSVSTLERWISLVLQGAVEDVVIVDPLARSVDLHGSEFPGGALWRESLGEDASEDSLSIEVVMAYLPDPPSGTYRVAASVHDSSQVIVSIAGHTWGAPPCGTSKTFAGERRWEFSASFRYFQADSDSCFVYFVRE